MTYIEIFKVIINFLLSLPKETMKEIHIYKRELSISKDDKDKSEMVKNNLLYFFLKNWLCKTLIPLILIILLTLFSIKYYIPILTFIFIFYLFWSQLPKVKSSNQLLQPQEVKVLYHEVSQFLFDPLKQMDEWLNVKQPQGISDILIYPSYSAQTGVDKLLFKLLKKSPEPIDIDKIRFSEKMLQSLITSKLDEKQRLENLNYFFNDVPILVVDYITDFGDFLQVQIVYVNKEISYNYVNQKAFVQPSPQVKTQPVDEDF